jgi:hypothetical protein
VYTVVIVSFMVDDMVHVMVHVMVFKKKGRWAEFQVLHSEFRAKPSNPRFVKPLKTLGFV